MAKLKRTSTEESEVKLEENIVVNDKFLQKFETKEIVFLAIITTVLTLTNGVMPLVAELTKVVFGIAQLVTGFQCSFFVTIGLLRVRKPLTIAFMMLLMGLVMLMMSPIMFVSNVFVILVAETVIYTMFKGYSTTKACFIGGAILPPLSLIVPTIYNFITVPEVFAVTTSNTGMVIGMILAVIIVGILGSFLALKVGKELIKTGVLQNGE